MNIVEYCVITVISSVVKFEDEGKPIVIVMPPKQMHVSEKPVWSTAVPCLRKLEIYRKFEFFFQESVKV